MLEATYKIRRIAEDEMLQTNTSITGAV